MAHVRDTWTSPNPNGGKRVKNHHWGKGRRWRAQWEENGKRRSQRFDTRDAANDVIAKIVTEKNEDRFITSDKRDTTLQELWDLWIPTKADTRPNTQKCYRGAWTYISQRFGATHAREITRVSVESWLGDLTMDNGQKAGQSLKRSIVITIKALMATAVEIGVITSNPLTRLRAQVPKTVDRRYLTLAELASLIDSMPDEPSKLLVMVLSRTGIRPSEAFALTVADLNPDTGRVRVSKQLTGDGKITGTKTHTTREVPVTGELLDKLIVESRHQSPDAPLLRRTAGDGWTVGKWRRVWRAHCDLGITTYELRHTAASMAIHSGASVKTIQRMLGHASAAMTLDTYGHLFDSELDTVATKMDDLIAAERRSRLRLV